MFYTICGMLAGFPAFVLVWAGIRGELQMGGSIAASLISLAYIVLGVIYYFDNSELVLDETGISRVVFGRVRMPIAWNEIKVIREQFLANQRYGGEICIDIFPNAPSDFALRFRRTIKFTEQFDNFDELIDSLNQRIKQYSIPIEVCSQGFWRSRSELVATPER